MYLTKKKAQHLYVHCHQYRFRNNLISTANINYVQNIINFIYKLNYTNKIVSTELCY